MSNSKRGRPARKMNEDRIIKMVRDFFYSPDYFKKLFSDLNHAEEQFFNNFFKDFHDKLSEQNEEKTPFYNAPSKFSTAIELLYKSDKSELEIQEEIKELNASVPSLSDDDIAEFQSAIDKLPDSLWTTYNNRLRQKEFKMSAKTKQISLSSGTHLQLTLLKDAYNAKSFNELIFMLSRTQDKVEKICEILLVDNIDKAIEKLKQMTREEKC
ncbi:MULTISPECIES: hypothetical protein [unclassified Pseudoalteromonas]|uniref:hypothetical protein n=1 Tax=unclassified Pseudoalteromonas TaxID=194690 RepID=UPI0004B85EC9|nr:MULTISPECIES: hypothetical protein [unclassified Pseudoalteromonas]